MPPGEITLAELLRDRGYRTALFGKWHLGTSPDHDPIGQGFDEFFGHRGGCIDNYSHYFYWQGPHIHDLWRNCDEVHEDGMHFTELLVRESRRFVEQNKSQPFFLYLALNLPHYPTQAPEKFRKLYANLPEPRRSYAATVSYLDDAVGRILARVDQLKLRERTLVIFLSDHGHSTEERTGFGGGNAGPYRGAKFSLLEGGIRVPCIASWPGRIPQGEAREQFGASVDWFPTIAELCGVPLPPRRLDAKSLASVLKSSQAKSPHEVFHWQLGNQWAVREGDWKLVVNGVDTRHGSKLEGPDRVFLSNLARDVSETKNLASENPDIVQRLTRLHDEWVNELR
jgi:arylsulfatase A